MKSQRRKGKERPEERKKKMMKRKQLWCVTVSEKALLQFVEHLKVFVVFSDVNLAYKLLRKHK
jgi:rRNA-processing protein FCF1